MKCPKCGHGNPDETLFCEECDWKMDQSYKKPQATIPPLYAAAIGIVLGIVSVALWYLEIFYGAIGFGAVGLVISSYSMSVARRIGGEKKVLIIPISIVAMALCAIGFLMGIYSL